MISRILVVLAVAATLLFIGCAKPPEMEITAASTAMQTLREAEAELYIPQDYKMAMDTLNAANAAKTEADGKFALFRSYKTAKNLYVSAETLAKSATEKARAEKERVRMAVMAMLEQATVRLGEADTALAKAPVGKGNKAEIELIKTELAAVRTALDDAKRDTDTGKYLVAQSKLKSVMDRTARVQQELATATAKKTGGKK
ncbi:DUF4398 domain-containing protein [bacterium]|nr:DUF4398 domain-containing protein [bacterium]MBU1985342.1 DUF4398 domain-containing protein [bacterium]